MSTAIPLNSAVPRAELSIDEQDWKSAGPVMLASLFSSMHIIRAFEEAVRVLACEGLFHGPAHSSID